MAERIWRKSGWQNKTDYRSQNELARLYGNSGNSDHYDPVEAFVWSYLVSLAAEDVDRDLYRRARERRQDLYAKRMSHAQRTEAQLRLIYILSCRGADGLFTLGEIFADAIEPGAGSARLARSERLMKIFYTLAARAGSAAADSRLKDLNLSFNDYRSNNALADGWMPPFERYPGKGYPGRRYTDHCIVDAERQRALSELGGLDDSSDPEKHGFSITYVRDALASLGFLDPKAKGKQAELTRNAVQEFQRYIETEDDGRLTPELMVQIIQTAAILGNAAAQNVLGTMYYYGLGVPCSNKHAHKWFKKAAERNHMNGLRNFARMYQRGRMHRCPGMVERNPLAGVTEDRALSEISRQKTGIGREYKEENHR